MQPHVALAIDVVGLIEDLMNNENSDEDENDDEQSDNDDTMRDVEGKVNQQDVDTEADHLECQITYSGRDYYQARGAARRAINEANSSYERAMDAVSYLCNTVGDYYAGLMSNGSNREPQ